MNTKQVSEATFQSAKATLGEKGIVDLIGITGFYSATSLLMNVDRYPMQSAAFTQPGIWRGDSALWRIRALPFAASHETE